MLAKKIRRIMMKEKSSLPFESFWGEETKSAATWAKIKNKLKNTPSNPIVLANPD